MCRRSIAVLIAVALVLTACGGAEDRKAAYMAKGEALAKDGNFEKARLEFQNVLQIDPKDTKARFALAQALEKLQNWRDAAGHYQAIIETEPENKDALFRMGQIYLLGRKTEDAGGLAARILALEPANPDGLVLRAGVKAAGGDLDGAMDDARQALVAVPYHVNASALVSSLLLRKGEGAESVRVLDEAIAHHAGDATLRALLARVHAQLGHNDEAAKLFADIAAQEPGVLAHRLRLANFYISAGKLDEAEATLKSAVSDFKDEVNAKLGYAEFLAKQRSAKTAVDTVEKMIAAQPDEYALRFALGKLYEAMKELPKAREVYAAIMDRDPKGPHHLAAKTRLAVVAGLEGKKDEALRAAGEVLAENPTDQDALVLRGSLLLDKGDAPAAIADFRAALRDAPAAVNVLRLLARAHLANGEKELARDTLQKAISENPTDLALRGDLAGFHSAQGDLDAALADLDGILKIAPDNESAFEAEFKIHVYRKAWDQALALSERLKTARANSPTGYYFAGLVYQAQSRFKDSIEQFESALAVAPDAVQPLSQLIKSHLALQQKDVAVQRLIEVLERNPKHFVAHNLLGELRLADKRYADARQSFEAAIAGNQEWPVPYRNLASVHLGEQHKDQAIEVMKRGIEATHGSALLVTALAGYLESTGDLDSAMAQYETVLKDTPGSVLAANNLAMLLIEYKDDAASRERARALAAPLASADNPAFLDTAGWVEYKFGNHARAVELLEKAVTAAPDAAIIRYHLGMAYLAMGNKVQARDHLKQAIESNVPFRGSDEAKTALKDIDAG